MRRLLLNVAVSLDGFIEGPNGEYDWCFTDQDYGMKDFIDRIDSMFMGRKSYELVTSMEGETGFPKMKEYIFSNTLSSVREDGELVAGDIAARVQEIKQQPGKDIWLFGGAELTSAMMNLGLVDEIQLAVHPILLGSGKPLFLNLDNRKALRLLDTRTYSSGLVSMVYEPTQSTH